MTMSDNPNNNPPSGGFNRDRFKEAIAWVESSGGKYLDNPNSSAAGAYHFLYNYIKEEPIMKGISKREFINNRKLQEQVMDMAIDGKLTTYPGYSSYAKKLKSRYGSNLPVEEIAAITHFLGAGNVKKYLQDPNNFKVPGHTNATVSQYLDRFRSVYHKNAPTKTEMRGAVHEAASLTDVEKPEIPVEQVEQVRDNIPQDNVVGNRFGPQFQMKHIKTEYKPQNETDVLSILNKYESGGYVNSDGLVKYENGGSHESNPLGGVPIGRDSNGTMNLVEEGESKFKFSDDSEYIFSDRLGLNNYYK